MSDRVLLSGFLKWETGSGDVLLCDGGTLLFGGDRYRASHATFGTIAGFEPISEGVGDEAPSGTLTFSPHPDAAPSDVSSATLQGSRIRMWIGEFDPDTGAVIGDPELMNDALVDVTTLKSGRGTRSLAVDIIPRTERLFLLNEGNVLSGEFHRRTYPAERGLDNALGVPMVVAWGVVGAPRGTASGGGGGGSYLPGGGLSDYTQ